MPFAMIPLRVLYEFVYDPAVSFLLTCPNCGIREVTDFGYGGEISARPTSRPDRRELNTYNYFRRNVAGVQREWWFHRSGCRAWFVAERDTTTNDVKFTALPGEADEPQTPEAGKAGGEGLVT
jgi:heterotetrameric sarcosine oxidase delta subunit